MIKLIPSPGNTSCYLVYLHKKIKMERSRLKRNAYVSPTPLFEFTYPHNQCTK